LILNRYLILTKLFTMCLLTIVSVHCEVVRSKALHLCVRVAQVANLLRIHGVLGLAHELRLGLQVLLVASEI